MLTACRAALLLSAALLLKGADSRSALEVLRDLKNRIFIPANVPPPTQKPYPECSALDEVNGTCFFHDTTLNETQSEANTINVSLPLKEISDTTEKTGNETENEEGSAENSEEDMRFAVNETQQITNYTQYYDEQDWNVTMTNETQEETGSNYESDNSQIVKNGTTDANAVLTTQINEENATQTKPIRRKRDVTNQTVYNITLKAEGIFTDKPFLVNTTVFTSKVENSSVLDTTLDQDIKNDNKTQLNVTIPNNLYFDQQNVTEQNTSEEPVDLLEDYKTDNIAEKNYFSNATTDKIKHYLSNENMSSSKVIFNSVDAEKFGLEEMFERNSSKYVETLNLNNATTSEPSHSTEHYVVITNTSLKNVFSVMNEVNEAGSHLTNDKNTNNTYHNETRENTSNVERINLTDSNNLLMNVSTLRDPQVEKINTENGISTPDGNSTIKGNTNLPNLENIIINSTQLLEKFFQNITNVLPTLGPEITKSISTGNDAEQVKQLQEEIEKYFPRDMLTNFTKENITTSTSTNIAIDQNYDFERVTDLGYNKSIDENTTKVEENENTTFNSLFVDDKNKFVNNVDNESLLLPNGPKNLNNTTTKRVNITNNAENESNTGNFMRNNEQISSIPLTFREEEAGKSGSVFNETVTSSSNTTEEFDLEPTVSGAWDQTIPFVQSTVCSAQHQQCTNSTDCCKPFICVTSNEDNSTTYCDFRPPDPDLPSPLPETGNPLESQL